MLTRTIKPTLNRLLDRNPAVVLIGPRQAGKTTLARELARERDAVYVDLERPSDLAKITDIEQYCDENAGQLLVLDEVHRVPGCSPSCAVSLMNAGKPESGRDCSCCSARPPSTC